MTYSVDINYKWCKKCGLCAKYCPKQVYELDQFGKPLIVNESACIGCNLCVYRCPDFAININTTSVDDCKQKSDCGN